MSTPASTILNRLHIPVHSYIAAAQAAAAYRTEFDLHKYNTVLSELTGKEVQVDELPVAQMTFGYFVQELVRSMLSEPKTVDELFTIATEKATTFVKREPWHWTSRDSARVTRIEEVKRYVAMFQSVDRQVLIDRLAEDFDISKPTAMTYLRQLDKECEDVNDEPKAASKPKINKGAEAAKLMAAHFTGSNKEEMLQMIVKELDTSRGGAQTFYYAAIKTLGLAVDKSAAKGTTSTQEKLRPIIEQNPGIDKNSFIDAAEKLGIKRTTAQTYYYSMTAELGVTRVGTGTRGRKKAGGVSRAEQVVEFMKSHLGLAKNEMIVMLSEHFNVGKLSAQSYYYAAKNAV